MNGRMTEPAVKRADKFIGMINGQITEDSELEELNEAIFVRSCLSIRTK